MWNFRNLLALQFAVAAGLPLLGLLLLGFLVIEPQLQKQVEAQHHSVAISIAGQVETYLVGAGNDLQDIAQTLNLLPQSNWQEVLDVQVGNAEVFNSILLVDANGIATMAGLPADLRKRRANFVGTDLSRRDFFQQMRSTGESTWSNTFLSTSSGKLTVAFTLPLQQQQGLSLVGEISLDRLSSFIALISTRDQLQIVAIDRIGALIAHPDPELSGQQISLRHLPVVAKALNGNYEFSQFDYQDQVVAGLVVPVSQVGWIILVTQPVSVAYRSINITNQLILISLLFGLIMAIGGSIVFARSNARKMGLFVGNAEKISRGEYELEWPGSRVREFGLLAKNLDSMASAIESREKELEQYHDHLEELVSERTRQLQSINNELEAFTYSVSHDLKAPLRSIDGFSNALIEDCADRLDESGLDYLNRVMNAAQRMGQLIDDLLKLSKISKQELLKTNVDISDSSAQIIQRLQANEPDRQVEYSIQVDLTTRADEGLASVALENLIGNAWKYTSKTENPSIEIGAESKNNKTVFYVKDNGAGFDSKNADRLFGAFQRYHKTSEFPGSGIGLATVSRIINRHGGKIWAESAENEGAVFFFTFD